jgi:hypothetical protein
MSDTSQMSHGAGGGPVEAISDIQRFEGGQTLMKGAGAVGLVGVLATFAGTAIDARAAMFSYLWAFAYWAGLALASVVLLLIFHAVNARWMVVLRRAVETMAVTIVVFAVLFIPIAAGLKHLYAWVDPSPSLPREALAVLEHKRAYLNTPFFVIRGLFYTLVAGFVAQRLFGMSTRQDQSGDPQLTVRQRRFGTGFLPLVALSFSFAAFDWMMSLDPLWFSTIFGIYYFGGSFVSAISLLVIVTDRARGRNLYGELVSEEHIHNLGKLMLAFTCFWGYIGFSQFLLIWIASLPEEVPYYILRMKGEWAVIGVFLIVGHFVLPFGALLSRSLKRNRRQLAVVAFWILFVHAVDIYWLVMPALSPTGLPFHWTMLTAFVGVGGLAIAFALWKIRGHFTLPVRDPYLADSLAYRQP